jgi:hypothetical protein
VTGMELPDDEPPSWLQDAPQLAHARCRVGNLAQDGHQVSGVEGGALKRKLARVRFCRGD